VRQKRKEMPPNFSPKHQWLERGAETLVIVPSSRYLEPPQVSHWAETLVIVPSSRYVEPPQVSLPLSRDARNSS
jgi:hypothetical protein